MTRKQHRLAFLTALAIPATLAAFALGFAEPAGALGFPATGQTTSYTVDKNDRITGAVAVPDDGALQAGATLSYTDNGDGTITDNNTGLMWEKKGDNGGLHDKDNSYSWSGGGETIWDWLDDVNAEGGAGFAGHNDWRIPNIKELDSLVNFQNTAPTTSAAFNNNCVAHVTVLTGSCTATNPYWSSTTWPTNINMAAGVNFYSAILQAFDKVSAPRVRAVRGGLSGPLLTVTGQTTSYTADKNDGITGAVAVPDDGAVQAGAPFCFTDNGDGTVTDSNTGLVWEKKDDSSGLHDKDNFYYWNGNSAQETLWDWLDDVNAEAFAGSSSWRIPNARELLSIANFQGSVPAAFNNNCVPGVTVLTGSCTKNLSYFTSTSDASSALSGTTITAWYVNRGTLYPTFKSDALSARAVHGGTP
jgi:hypothetical protein